MKILLLDDNDEVRDSLGELLKIMGHDVLLAPDGETGIKLLAQNPDTEVIVTDYNMLPGISGMRVIKHVAENYPAVRKILMSGDLTGELKKRAETFGASTIEKLDGPRALIALIEKK